MIIVVRILYQFIVIKHTKAQLCNADEITLKHWIFLLVECDVIFIRLIKVAIKRKVVAIVFDRNIESNSFSVQP